ncbi:cytochrome P450 [Streptomyces sp. ISL-10]|uniref:cytochrome P450 n=1 Tax=Streptomyces sp. ISL-10 TaxID=2819172 RepID=UPI001BEABD0D|nr:cytochrome P450 [Streptomyces sp. ISL-10]MBT2364144.1 cytochrome P450 [Streptomyces sp. ISL-10]
MHADIRPVPEPTPPTRSAPSAGSASHRPGSPLPGLPTGDEHELYEGYRRLREEYPLTYDASVGAWLLSRYRDVATALTDLRFTHGHRPGDVGCAAHLAPVPHAMRETVQRTAYVLARRIAGREQADLVEEYCRWLPSGAVGVRGSTTGRALLAGRCVSQISVREKALASFFANLLDHPVRLATLRTDPRLIARAWTESLRRDPPVLVVIRRTAAEVALSGGTLPAGAAVACLIGAAGRDPERFRDPHHFDPLRSDPGQLTYGLGGCPAVELAAMEAEYGLRALIEAMPRLRWADGFRPVASGLITRSPKALLVRPRG